MNDEKTGVRPENKMGVMPINRLLLTMSLPMIVSMLVQALYNIVDSVFVAMLSEQALTSVSLAFPAQMLMISVGGGTGVGMNALLSRSLGERNFEVANRAGRNGLFLAAAAAVIFAVAGIFLSAPFFASQTDIAGIADGGAVYLRICYVCSFGVLYQMTLERLLQSTGRTLHSMLVQLFGAIINIILDPVMIFGLLGFPRLGVAGAALATVTGQCSAALLAAYINVRKNREINLDMRGFRPDWAIIKRIYSVGAPSILMASIGSVMVFGFNTILIQFTTTAAAVFGVYFKLQSFIFLPIFGLNNGMVPIIAYNFGACRPERVKRTVTLSVCYATGIMLAGLAVFWLFTPQLLGLFNASEAMLLIGIPALRRISLSFMFAGFCICTLSVCQALGHGIPSLIVSIVRQLVVVLPAAYILARLWGLEAVWWSFIIGELVSVALCVYYMRRMYVSEIKPLGAVCRCAAAATEEGRA
ncbi:MAG: MATE family efflux transporter [Synergistaceae bacterium]|jgi:putative MATE family efflux protein|nr:MATE family efflux transporter [Synergistaceae bacterium]